MQCAWREREPRHKSLIMTSNNHFVWRSTDEAKLEHIREKKINFALRRKAIILITTLEIILLVITNLTSGSSLKR